MYKLFKFEIYILTSTDLLMDEKTLYEGKM